MADKSVQDRVAQTDDDEDPNIKNLKAWSTIPGKAADVASSVADAVSSVAAKVPSGADSLRDDMAGISYDQRQKMNNAKYQSEPMTTDEVAALGRPPDKIVSKFAPTPSGTTEDNLPNSTDTREHVRQAIKNVESSGGNYAAVNQGAYGAYQFRPKYWNELSEQVTGHTVQELVPTKNDSPEDVAQKKADQDKLFDAYYTQQLDPWVKAMRKDGLGDQYSDTQLAGLFHFRGAAEGQKFLEGKIDDSDKGGTTIKTYLARIDSGSKGGGYGDRTRLADGATAPATRTGGNGDRPDLMGALDSSDAGDSFIASLRTPVAKQAAMSLASASTQGQDAFTAELGKIQQQYDNTKDNIAQRELFHTLAEAFTKFGAGMAGMKSGMDMSHVTVAPHDYQKDTELAQSERRMSLDDLKARREEQQRSEQFGSQMDLEAKSTAARLNQQQADRSVQVYNALRNNDHQTAQEEIAKSQQEYERARLKLAENREDKENRRKYYEAFENRKATATAKITAVLSSKEYAKNPAAGNAGIEAELHAMGVPSKDAHEAAFKDGMLWGQNPQSPEDIMPLVHRSLDRLVPNELHTQPVTVTAPNGKNYSFSTQESADDFKRKAGI